MALADLAPELVRAWYGALVTARGRSAAAKAYTRLGQILSQAVDDDRIAKNPCRMDGGGAERHPEQRFASLAELYRLASAVPDRYRALVLMAGLAGLRRGELFGLRRGDIDLLNATVKVRRMRLRLASGEVIEGDPKSEAGKRTVALPGPLVVELERHLARYVSPGANAYVCSPLPRGSRWSEATFVSASGPRHDGSWAGRVALPRPPPLGRDPCRPYWGHHEGDHGPDGHASPLAAMVYQHAAEDRDRRIADRLADMTIEAGLASRTGEGKSANSGRPEQTL